MPHNSRITALSTRYGPCSRTHPMPVRVRRALQIVATAVLAVLIPAACGGSSGPVQVGTNPSPNSSSSPVGMSRCMRAHGLSNFPDPSNGSGGVGFHGVILSANGTLVVDGITFAGPVAEKAESACRRFLPPAGPPPAPSAAQKAAAVKFAQCMRTHGVPDFPDPTFSSTRGPNQVSSLNLDSPAFKQAAAACGGAHGAEIRIGSP